MIDFDPRLNFVFFFLLWCMVGFKLLELVNRVSQFCNFKCYLLVMCTETTRVNTNKMLCDWNAAMHLPGMM